LGSLRGSIRSGSRELSRASLEKKELRLLRDIYTENVAFSNTRPAASVASKPPIACNGDTVTKRLAEDVNGKTPCRHGLVREDLESFLALKEDLRRYHALAKRMVDGTEVRSAGYIR
jgi:hypothetical protein